MKIKKLFKFGNKSLYNNCNNTISKCKNLSFNQLEQVSGGDKIKIFIRKFDNVLSFNPYMASIVEKKSTSEF